ncbi:D-alanyl-D-alanine carboxypeptidase/D-alanyl-D-alanine-endopeptidase [Streptomyces sp. CRN 30]|uniref:D-alanyl-D-alanine carboxypeptidase/D-alanyl-D-alanine endopeptidase n=1 Tax=Streptomyces sp. CRN 30 TaxID=3075613 RepID=UPI002A821D11|nr:D-alanyl-D-alanine carboxypeptidase/D-alanyl-D-alanine-endopeptidase [Streptomyces sp. CRN 30]
MVVPEPKGWRAARPHVVRIARAARSRAERVTRVVAARSTGFTTLQFAAGAATAGLLLAAGAVTVAGPWDSTGQRTAERDRAAARDRQGGTDHGPDSGWSPGTAQGAPKPAPSAPSVLAGLGGSGSAPGGRALAGLLDPLLDDEALGPRHTAAVVDVATGKVLYGRGADDASTPASTTKIATAAAALSAAGADHRIETRTVLAPGSDEVVLVGGGDPTLTAREDAEGYASLRELADETAAALRKRHLDEITLAYDTSLYEGPALHSIGPNPNLARVTPLMVDEARLDDSTSGPADRAADPAEDAAQRFEELLEDRGITARSVDEAEAAKGARILGSVSSPPLSALVERMLTSSDNDIAEALARQTALASGEPASFAGAGTAIRDELRELGLPLDGVRFADGSGLSRDDRMTADLLTALLAEAASPRRPGLRPVLTGLPIAGFTGTLRDRYADETSGTGLVRAKTGTLTGVNTLAGTVVDADGRLLAFAFLATGTTDPTAAQQTLDRAASALAGCGCR